MAESTLLKRTFRTVATVAGLIERNHPGQRKTGRQVTFSADLIYNVLRRHEPNHILLRATRQDAATGLTDIRRLGRNADPGTGPHCRHQKLDRVSPPRRANPARDRPRIGRRRSGREDLLAARGGAGGRSGAGWRRLASNR